MASIEACSVKLYFVANSCFSHVGSQLIRLIIFRFSVILFSSHSRKASLDSLLYVTHYEKTYHSQENMILQYGVQ